jgi:hypothetical protein
MLEMLDERLKSYKEQYVHALENDLRIGRMDTANHFLLKIKETEDHMALLNRIQNEAPIYK